MKIVLLTCLVAAFAVIECHHTFLGTNILKPLIYHNKVQYRSYLFRKRIEYLNFTMPAVPSLAGRTIQGILAYDLTNSSASANVTQGGLGYNYVNLRMKSERASGLHYEVYIYA